MTFLCLFNVEIALLWKVSMDDIGSACILFDPYFIHIIDCHKILDFFTAPSKEFHAVLVKCWCKLCWWLWNVQNLSGAIDLLVEVARKEGRLRQAVALFGASSQLLSACQRERPPDIFAHQTIPSTRQSKAPRRPLDSFTTSATCHNQLDIKTPQNCIFNAKEQMFQQWETVKAVDQCEI